MSVTVTKLRGNDIPEAMRGPDVQVVFRITDQEGNTQYLLDDVEAAQTAVRVSDDHHARKE
jgi:hypothetical protein